MNAFTSLLSRNPDYFACRCPKYLSNYANKYGFVHLTPIECAKTPAEAKRRLAQLKRDRKRYKIKALS